MRIQSKCKKSVTLLRSLWNAIHFQFRLIMEIAKIIAVEFSFWRRKKFGSIELEHILYSPFQFSKMRLTTDPNPSFWKEWRGFSKNITMFGEDQSIWPEYLPQPCWTFFTDILSNTQITFKTLNSLLLVIIAKDWLTFSTTWETKILIVSISECDVSVSKLLGFETFPFFWWFRIRYRKILVSEKVSDSVS